QAEDGIRDFHVTGVQTCALPISRSMARTIIANGTVVTATDRVPADVLVEDEKIVALAAPGSHDWTADETIDAAGKYVIPGGIDEIGRASCRERVQLSVRAVPLEA